MKQDSYVTSSPPAAPTVARVSDDTQSLGGAVYYEIRDYWLQHGPALITETRKRYEKNGWGHWDLVGPIVPRLVCADGFTMSVQAGSTHYCQPRITDERCPYYQWEVGYPSASEPLLLEFAEDQCKPTETVYGYVPSHVINEVIRNHGGIVGASVSDQSREAVKTKGLDPKDASAVTAGQTPHPSPVDYTEVVERLKCPGIWDAGDECWRVSEDGPEVDIDALRRQAAQVIEAQAADFADLSSRYREVEADRERWMERAETAYARIAELEKERDEAVRQERESCAFDAECVSGFGDPWTIETIAANIRARGPEDEKELVHVPRETFERFKAADSRLADAVKVIEPFAEFASASGFGMLPDDMPMTQGSRFARKQVTAKDFRAARSFLSTGGDSHD